MTPPTPEQPPRALPARLRRQPTPVVLPHPVPGPHPAPVLSWAAAGFGTDPDGDAERRTEQGVVELPDGTTVAGLPDGHPLALDPPTPDEAEYMERLDRQAVLGGYGLPAARAQAEARELRAAADRVEDRAIARAVDPDLLTVAVGLALPVGDGQVVEGELPADDPHKITRTEYPSGVSWVCACGQWEGFATGPSSAAWAGADHRRHVAAARPE